MTSFPGIDNIGVMVHGVSSMYPRRKINWSSSNWNFNNLGWAQNILCFFLPINIQLRPIYKAVEPTHNNSARINSSPLLEKANFTKLASRSVRGEVKIISRPVLSLAEMVDFFIHPKIRSFFWKANWILHASLLVPMALIFSSPPHTLLLLLLLFVIISGGAIMYV